MASSQCSEDPDPVDDPQLQERMRHLGGLEKVHDHPDFVAGRKQARDSPTEPPRACRDADREAFLVGHAYELYLQSKRRI